MQEVGLFFMRQRLRNTRFQRGLLRIVFQQIAKVNAAIPEQTQMQFATEETRRRLQLAQKSFS